MQANLLTEWARLLIGSFAQAGVAHAVISPGSRSTPLVAALQATPAIQMHSVIDERSAAFFALGMAKLTGVPPLLVCTSGTALAHYFPALIEASQSYTPLLVLSADRPAELQACAAPQTIPQSHLYGQQVRGYFDLAAPHSSDLALRALRRKAVQALALSRGPVPGPVHLNFPAAKPLEPVLAHSPDEQQLQQRVSALLLTPAPRHFQPLLAASPEAIEELLALAARAERPLFAFGPAAPHQAAQFHAARRCAEEAGWPWIAECTSTVRWFEPTQENDDIGRERAEPTLGNAVGSAEGAGTYAGGADVLFRSAHAAKYAPDFVVHFGGPLTSGSWSRWLMSDAAPKLAVVSPHAWTDPENRANLMIAAAPEQVARALSGRLPPAAAAWRALWLSGERAVQDSVKLSLPPLRVPEPSAASTSAAASTSGAVPLGSFAEPSVFRALAGALQPGDLFVIGNSLPVRLADTLLPAKPSGVTCLGQRGANGIDGLIALAAGASQLHSRPTLLVLGDVSALHDIGSLQLLARIRSPLCVLVINNQGGRIFEHLPAGELLDTSAWITPHDFELWRNGSAWGLPAMCVESEAELSAALLSARLQQRPTLIETRVKSDGAEQWYRKLQQLLDARLTA